MVHGKRSTYLSTAMDRVFADARIVALVGPIAGLDPQDVRATLTAAENSSATPRLALDPRADTRRWTYRNNIAADKVEHLPDADTSDLGALLTEVRGRDGVHSPLEAIVGGDYLAVDYSHCIGDGQIGLMLLAALSGDPRGTLAPTLAVGLPTSSTWKALTRHYRENPSALRDFWALRQKHKRPTDNPVDATRRVENWERAKLSRVGYMEPAQVAELRTWATENAAGATTASISVALWSAALRAEKVPVDDQIMILFNSRRYLGPEYLAAHGNFAVGIPLHLPAQTTPERIAATMREVIESGWPIAVLGMSEIKDRLASIRKRPALPKQETVEVPDRVRLAVSDLGKLPMFGHTTWADDGRPPQVAASLEPDGPDGMTLLIAEVAGGRTYTASFCDRMIETQVVDAALARVCADPVGLLRDVYH